jgi:hypothetical protein
LSDERIAEHTEIVLKLYYSNGPWQSYLDSLQDKREVEEEVSNILIGVDNGQESI